ncbi:MAG: Rne/Rng family ribonuclease, partial [Caulobacteraceae bacterium]
MPKTMLIDAAHREETRVVVLNGTRIEEFDFESRAKKQLRGNIYLAKVTRVEPSLQAAFVEYGGNRHGFLAFNEIHPDYYQIPHADREALLRETQTVEVKRDTVEAREDAGPGEETETGLGLDEDEEEIEEEIAHRRSMLMRRYKIQEVIKRRQIMLIQVVKEERGTKGAALTTYLSLAGRYGVLMPNTDRGGGVSRKISAATDRKRLRAIIAELKVPSGMGLIVRTAGAKRTKAEIKRDYDYLLRTWETIRDTTLHSIAPALIYEEEDLLKRAIRDLYDKDVDGIWVEGEAAFQEARDFMRMLIPSQAKKIQPWREPTPLFIKFKAEDHLSQIYSPTVPLRSGGYLVINQTEALVAIDVNSGRATKERNIEATALKTNLEAAEEAARQLRLRDLAGLIVIDFIDMEETKNTRAVEKKLRDCLKDDRARIQVGHISGFGLMELSRQRRRTGILEVTTEICPHCQGAGRVRSVASSALSALRSLEMEAVKGGGEVVLRAAPEVALYILNHKREPLVALQRSHGLSVRVTIDEALAHADHEIDRISAQPAADYEGPEGETYALSPVQAPDEEQEEEEEAEISFEDGETEADAVSLAEGARRRSRRRRRGRRGEEKAPESLVAAEAASPQEGRSRRRRGRRGGHRPREDVRGEDGFGWNWPAKLSGADPYEWRGPVEPAQPTASLSVADASGGATGARAPADHAALARPASPPSVPGAAPAAEPTLWVELPAEEAKPASRRRRREPKPRAIDGAPPIEEMARRRPLPALSSR